MEIFLKNRLSLNYEITFLPYSAALPFVSTCVLANTGVPGKPPKPWLAPEAPEGLKVVGGSVRAAWACGFLLVFRGGGGGGL